MSGGGTGLSSGAVAEAALEAWMDCGPEGYVLDSSRLSASRLAGRIPCRSKSAADLGRLFVEQEGEPAIFVQMLRPQEGKVHFLYFWKAFGEAARIAGALAIETETLAVELAMLRDRVLRLVEEALLSESSSSSNGFVPKSEMSVQSMVQEVERAASMSAYPQFWTEAAKTLKTRDGGEMLALEDVTSLLLSWLQDATMWEHERDAPPPPPKAAKGLPVLLHVYDVSQEESIQKLNKVLAHKHFPLKFGGVFHAGVEVNGLEWCFGFSASETHPGVCCVEPKSHPQHHYRQTVEMGYTRREPEEIADIVTQLLEEYPGDDYDLLRRNCCHFADDFTRRLGVGSIPGWVMRLARVGAGVDAMIQSAPKPIRQRLGYFQGSDSD
ncbi:unnamed protein product [Effrenium voratum]|nr:unnamed protein product [Effrenium voratum]